MTTYHQIAEMASPTLKLSDYDAFGFDIDHTLAKYNLPNLFDLVYKGISTYMVEKKGYDEYLLQPFDRDFCTRGLVFDIKKGNFLKLAEDGTILRASHGTKRMTDAEIEAVYGSDHHLEHSEIVIKSVDNIEGEIMIFENFFDMTGSVLCARLVDVIDKKEGKTPNDYDLLSVWEAYNDAYLHTNFRDVIGSFFPAFINHTEDYIRPCSDALKRWLKSLKEQNKLVFVMSSSYADYACYSLKFILGDDWKEYFDVVLSFAKKPGFFNKNRDFLRLDGDLEKEAVFNLEADNIYSQGNLQVFEKFLVKATGKEKPKVVYFGDSLRSDMFPSKTFADWSSVMVLEEMEAEIGVVCPGGDSGDGSADVEPVKKASKIEGPSQLEREYLTSANWGSLFTDDHWRDSPGAGCKQMNTLWGYMIRMYSDIAIPHLDYIVDMPLDHEYPVFVHTEAMRWGFYPRLPRALQSSETSS